MWVVMSQPLTIVKKNEKIKKNSGVKTHVPPAYQ